jgi:hypothetical protein
MTKITTCDRCGNTEAGEYGMSSINFYNKEKKTYNWDLCPNCINELAQIIKEWVEKENDKRK